MVSTTIPNVKEVLLMKQEISLAKFLSSNIEFKRNKALKRINKWLTHRSKTDVDFNEYDFRVLWKGLFYCMWMADKPLYQEEVAEKISKLVHCFTKLDDVLLYVENFFSALGQQWLGIDHHRFDKCLMLVRRMVRQSMMYVKNNLEWSQNAVEALSKCYSSVLKASPNGLVMHLSELFLVELSKVSDGLISSECVLALVRPFAEHMRGLNDGQLIIHIASSIFFYLIWQSETGIKHTVKWEAWKRMGFRGGSIDALQYVERDEDSELESESESVDDESHTGEKPMDTRAGHVNVELKQLDFVPSQFVQMFSEIRDKKDTTTKARKHLSSLMNKFSLISGGECPFGMKEVKIPQKREWKKLVEQSAHYLSDTAFAEKTKNVKVLNGHVQSHSIGQDTLDTPVGKWSIESANKSKKKKKYRENGASKWEVVSSDKKVDNRFNETDNNELSESFTISSRLDIDVSDHEMVAENLQNGEKSELDVQTNKGKKRRRDSETPLANGCFDTKTEWDTPLEEGETEIFIPNKNYAKKRAKLGLPVPKPEFVQRTPKTPPSDPSLLRKSPYSSHKKVLFVLTRNVSQEEYEYQARVRSHPEIPFKADKLPEHGIYKDTGVKSPIDPFYKPLGYLKMKGF